MAKDTKRYTIFQKLDNAINNDWVAKQAQANIRSYNMSGNKQVLFKTDNKEEYDAKLQQMRQDKYLSNMWHATTDVLASENVNGASRLALMYRDVELMDGMPEIGTALDIVAEESTLPDDRGNVVNVYSSSERVKTILEDLFVNRLNLSVQAAMVIRGIAKYGNMYYLLNVDSEDGVKEWRQLPVEEMQRIESDIDSATGYQIVPMNNVNFNNSSKNSDKATPVRFVWLNGDQQKPYFSFQIAHFRLLTDNAFLPYGTSFLHKARRHWRQLSIMEDMMLIYRLERSIERRVFKIFVGNIDDKDVPAFMDEIANKFKRTIITDPLTGQVDLRKNLMPVHEDTPIPLLDGRTIKIKELAKEFEDGKTNYVYSIQDDTHKVVAGKVVWCGKNYTAKELYKITLDDDTYMVMAGEHEIVMRNGKKVRADEVAVGDSVMPFYNIPINTTINDIDSECIIKSIEIVGGADVYCMSVVGLNGEEDRHNFALRTIRQDGSWDINGCFVSNSVSDDYFIPTRDPSASSPIESLQGAQNLTAMDDIKYVQNKVLCALRIPMAFLNFDKDGGAGDGGNLAMKDIRFVRTVNRIQQAFLEELTKIATTHLYLLGFEDDLRNFTLTMNNPSTQAEQLEIETLGKKIDTIRNAVSDAGNGMPMMSMQRALKTVMKWSEKDIKENLQELRLEKALAKELEKTDQIIKRTTLFDEVDRIYGEPNAKYQDEENNDGGDQGGEPMGGGAGGGGGLGGGLDLGADTGDAGMEGEVPMDDAGGADAMAGGAPDAGGDAGAPPTEARTGQPVLTEQFKDFLGKKKGAISNNTPIYKKDIVVSEMTASINKFLQEQKQKEHDE